MGLRTIKFRGKSIFGIHEWIYGSLLLLNRKTYICPDKVVAWNMTKYEVIPETVGQFTGLFDENHHEIYEGDIVKWLFFTYGYYGEQNQRLKGLIKWHQGGFIFKVTENDFNCAGFYAISDLNTDTESEVKILGNIYDNPKLIKEDEPCQH